MKDGCRKEVLPAGSHAGRSQVTQSQTDWPGPYLKRSSFASVIRQSQSSDCSRMLYCQAVLGISFPTLHWLDPARKMPSGWPVKQYVIWKSVPLRLKLKKVYVSMEIAI